MLKAYGLEHPCLSRDYPGFPGISSPGPEMSGEPNCLWPSRLSRWQAGLEPCISPGEAFMNWFLPQSANAAWLEGQVPASGSSFLYSRPTSFLDRLPAGQGRCSLIDSGFSRSSPPGRTEPDLITPADLGPFYQDRLGLTHIIGGKADAAQATFQELAQHHDPFWQRLARVRLADLELLRLQAETAP